jgi:acetolactate decarboxylase
MRKRLILFIFLLLILAGLSCVTVGTQRDIIFQSTPLLTLSAGDFEGDTKCAELKTKGDFGLGTFNGLDGEMVMLEGVIYKVRHDGSVQVAGDEERTPFAAVTYFDEDLKFIIAEADSFIRFQELLDAKLPSTNLFYAVRVAGTFSYIKARSVPRFAKPYPTLAEAVKSQRVFEFNNIEGIMVGFRCPQYIGEVNVAGYHMHFISGDRKCGGHVLDCRLSDNLAHVDDAKSLHLDTMLDADFDPDRANAQGAE